MELARLVHFPSEVYLNMNFVQRFENWQMEAHTHSFHQLIWVTEGTLLIECQHQHYTLGKGKLCVIPPGHVHSLATVSGYSQFGLNMNSDDPTGMKELMHAHITEFVLVDYSHMLGQLAEVEDDMVKGTRLSRLKLVNQLDAILLSAVESAIRKSDADFRDRLLRHLKQHLSSKLTLKQLCDLFNLSQSHLERLVFKEFGCGAIELHNQLRLDRACSLLMNTERSIDAIANELGFYDSAHFSRLFKRKMYQTPSQYRKSSDLL
ncbi:AraC family transcriptional regulator [Paenibacillus hodogayensis]|uniref:AraC family transcriptional regulator n=1 Tax=Paenibacillus hodogayensis TaxID=279208 RepID=A0ABV5VYH6_9BACL